MSLDVTLTVATPVKKKRGSGIFIREDGANKEISEEEWYARFPDRVPYVVGKAQELDSAASQSTGRVAQVAPTMKEEETTEAYSANITHNLGRMAKACGIYEMVWRPEDCGITQASQLIEPLKLAIAKLKADPVHFKQYNPKNKWGDYDAFLGFLERYLQACCDEPNASVSVSR